MGVREFAIWSLEARRKRLLRISELYQASLLPHQSEYSMNKVLDELKCNLYEIDNEDHVANIENEARRRFEEMKNKRKITG